MTLDDSRLSGRSAGSAVASIRAWLRRISLASMSLLATSAVSGQSGVIVHEYIPPDVAEDLALGALTPSGKMPAALRTPSGLVSAPDKFRGPSDGPTPAYAIPAAKSAPRFRIDGMTSDPGTLHYHEPFRPSIAPFKRLYVFDAVNDAFELYLRDPARHAVPIEGAPEAGDDEFFADLTLASGQTVRIPSVASKMRVLAAELEPPIPFRLLVDTGENWFFDAPSLIGKARLIMRVAAPRAAMSPEIDANSYATLQPALPPVPASVSRAVEPILGHVGVSRSQSPATAVRALVAYFRSFVPSQQGIAEESGRELYEQLTLSRKGVCRHRAYAFVVTALVLGIPARFVHNEAHAWVEVYDGQLWHRVDLGGAASGLHYDGDKPEGPSYRMPKDNYEWPSLARPGEQLNPRQTNGESPLSATGSDLGASSNPREPASAGSVSSAAASPPTNPARMPSPPVSDKSAEATLPNSFTPGPQEPLPTNRSVPKVTFRVVGNSNVRRGEALLVEGNAQSEEGPCKLTRVDLEIRRDTERYAFGSTATDDKGRFRLQATVPLKLGIGPYAVTAASGDSASCRASGR